MRYKKGRNKNTYRKLELKWNHDKNPSDREEAEKNLKRIIVYSVLSDKNKKNNMIMDYLMEMIYC